MIIAIANQKGGVAKTTSTLALGGLLAEEGDCLIIDLDPQGNLTAGLGVDLDEDQLTAYEVITGRADAKKAIVETRFNVSLLPADISLAKAEKELLDREDRFNFLDQGLRSIRSNYDFILIDCPPSMGLLTVNALSAADMLLIPVQCQFFALKGLEALLQTIETVQQRLNPDLKILGVLPTMAEKNTVITQDVLQILRNQINGITVFDPVPKSVKFPESNLAGEPIHVYAKEWRVVQPYREVVKALTLLRDD